MGGVVTSVDFAFFPKTLAIQLTCRAPRSSRDAIVPLNEDLFGSKPIARARSAKISSRMCLSKFCGGKTRRIG